MCCSEWKCDGTFLLAPNGYEQLYVISGKMYNMWNPLIYTLMKNRKKEDYDIMWQMLLEKANENEYEIKNNPVLLLDFEKAAANSFKSLFPQGEILRCHFHFWQCLKKYQEKMFTIFIYPIKKQTVM